MNLLFSDWQAKEKVIEPGLFSNLLSTKNGNQSFQSNGFLRGNYQ